MSENPTPPPLDSVPPRLPVEGPLRQDVQRRSLLLLLFSILGSLGLLARVFQLVVQDIYPIIRRADFKSQDLAAATLEASAMLFCILALLPVFVGSWRALSGRSLSRADIPPIRLWQLFVLFILWFFVLVLATVLVYVASLGWVLAIPFFLVGIALPVAGLAWIGVGGLSGGSWRRAWAALGLGMLGGTGVALIVEYLLVLVGVALVSLFLAGDPAFQAVVEQFKRQIENIRNTEELFLLLAPILRNPLILFSILVVFAGLVPLIEELAKPLGVLLAGKSLRSPVEGFALGALGGAGFALMEGLLSMSGFIHLAGFGLIMRAAASLMHILASGLAGWGYASAILQRKYGRMVLFLVLAVGLHGLWNGATIVTVYSAFLLMAAPEDAFLALPMLAAMGMLVILFALSAVFLPVLNHQLRAARRPLAGQNLPAN